MITEGYKKNFDTLLRAVKAGDVCLLECKDKKTGDLAYVVCAVNDLHETVQLSPLARLFDSNPYEDLEPSA